MKTVLKYIIVAFAFYCSVNWMADNPQMVDAFRDKMNELVGVCSDKVKELVRENASESG